MSESIHPMTQLSSSKTSSLVLSSSCALQWPRQSLALGTTADCSLLTCAAGPCCSQPIFLRRLSKSLNHRTSLSWNLNILTALPVSKTSPRYLENSPRHRFLYVVQVWNALNKPSVTLRTWSTNVAMVSKECYLFPSCTNLGATVVSCSRVLSKNDSTEVCKNNPGRFVWRGRLGESPLRKEVACPDCKPSGVLPTLPGRYNVS